MNTSQIGAALKVLVAFVAFLGLVWVPALNHNVCAYITVLLFMLVTSMKWEVVRQVIKRNPRVWFRGIVRWVRNSGFFPTTRWLVLGVAVFSAGIMLLFWIGASYYETVNYQRLHIFPLAVLGYWRWASLQLIILLWFFYRQLSLACGGETAKACWLTGLIFGLIHLANPLLTFVCFTGGVAGAFAYRRWRGLVVLAFAQAVVACALMTFVPVGITGHMKVGRQKPGVLWISR